MNKRIKELISEAIKAIPDHVAFDLPKEFTEKFAELIVQECISQVKLRREFAIEDEHNVDEAFSMLIYDIESRFGIE